VGWALARKGKATSNVTYNPNDPPSAYSNPSIHSRIQAYTEMGRQVHGSDWDLRTQPLDGEVIMMAGGGKKHGRYYIGDGLVDTANTPTLSQIRVRSTANSPAIHPRLSASQLQVQKIQNQMLAQKAAYEVALAEERRLRQENEQKQAAEMAQMYNYIRSLFVQMGNPIPALPVVPAPTTPPNLSAASNTPDLSPGISPMLPQQLFPPQFGGPPPFDDPPQP